MAIVVKDRVKETTAVTGTGTATLLGAANGFQAFSAIGNGNITYYAIVNSEDGTWEVGKGTYSTTGPTLTRDTVYESSNAGALVNFAAGIKDIFCTYPAERAIYEEPDGQTLIDGGPITVLGNGVTSNPSLEAELGKFVGNVDSFGQVYNMNQNDGSSASADFVVYNDLTTDGFTHFTDMGINSSNYSSVDYPIFTPGSGYFFHDGDNLFIGTQTANKDVVLFAGGVDTTNEAIRIKGADQAVELASNLSVAGTQTVTGAAEFQSTVLLDADPTLALQAATKQYVDNATSNGFHVHTPVLVATTGNLTATYNNGTSGVGATLTNSGAQAAISVDGVSLSVNDRVLVWQQTTGLQNGVYVVTTVGSGSTNWVLTRSSDADTSSEGDPNSLGGGDYFFVQSGTTLGYHSYICTNTSTITFGTTAITFSEFSSVPAYTGTSPVNVSGNVISLSGAVPATNGGTGTTTVTTGDLLYGSATNTWSKLAAGSAYKSLVMNAGGTNVEWNAVALNQSGSVSGALPATNGGTGLTSYNVGELIYSNTTTTFDVVTRNTSTTKKFLTQTGTGSAAQAPVWGTISGSDVSGDISGNAAGATNVLGGAANKIVYQTGANTTSFIDAPSSSGTALTWNGSAFAWASAGGATITDDTTTNASYYPVWANATSGTMTTAYVSSTKLSFNPSTGSLTATGFSGPLTGNVTGNVSGTAGSLTNALTLGSYLTGTSYNGSGAVTAAVDATSANTASKVVARDASGNFSAGTITASLTGNVTGNVSGSSGSCTGNSATATTASALSATSWQRITGNTIDYGSYGSIGVSGVTNGYAGVSFSGVSGTLMMNSGSSGFYFSNSTWRVYWDASGNQINTGNVSAYASDERLKYNIKPIESARKKLRQIEGVYFDWDLEECNKWHFFPPASDMGLLAQRVQKIAPEAVKPAPFDLDPLAEGKSKSGKNYLTVQYEKMVPMLVQSSNEHDEIIDQLLERIAKLEALVEKLTK